VETITPEITIVYNKRNVTADLLPYLAAFEYLDNATGKSDEVTIQLADPAGLFIGDWYPEKGDTLEIYFGFVGNMVPAGLFEIDQIEVSGQPSTVSLMAIAAPTSRALRTRRSVAHENSSLRKIAEKVAERNGLTVTGQIDEALAVRRATQNRETDLSFLYRLARKYGYGFNVRGADLVFYSLYALEGEAAKKTIDLADVVSYAFRAKTAATYKSAQLSYHNPDTQEIVSFENGEDTLAFFTGASATLPTRTAAPVSAQQEAVFFENGEDTLAFFTGSADMLRVYEKAKDPATAAAVTRAALYEKNTQKVTGALVVVGDVNLLAGNNIEVTGAGKFSGRYHIESSRHTITPAGGYGTSLEIKKVG